MGRWEANVRRLRLRAALSLAALALALFGCVATPIDVIYLDLDGTLLTTGKTILPQSIEALQRFRACGGHVGVATGRTPEQALPLVLKLPVDMPIVLFNGGLTISNIRDQGGSWSVESTIPLTRDGAREGLTALAGSLPIRRPCIYVQYASGTSLASCLDSSFLAYAALARARVVLCESNDTLRARVEVAKELPLKIIAVTGDEATAVSLDRFLDATLRTTRSVVGDPRRGVVEILPQEVSKASAIRAVLASRGIDPQRVATFGDSENDVEMLRDFGRGYAMRSGMPAARRAADKVIGRRSTQANDTPVIASTVRSLLPRACRQSP